MFEVVGLAAGGNIELLAKQIKQHKPQIVSVRDSAGLASLRDALSGWNGPMPKLVYGEEGISEVAAYGDADTVVTGIVGCAGLLPTIEAIKAGKDIALANKETLISGGEPAAHPPGLPMRFPPAARASSCPAFPRVAASLSSLFAHNRSTARAPPHPHRSRSPQHRLTSPKRPASPRPRPPPPPPPQGR
jgi:hypothetical protein